MTTKEVIAYGSIGIQNGFVYKSDINDSSIDMNDRKITMLADPVYEQDAVNLRTLNSHSGGGVTQLVIVLSGTNPTVISSDKRGSYGISVFGETEGAPCGTFNICKTRILENVDGSRSSSTCGSLGDTRLYVNWPSNSGLQLYKDTLNHDGNYVIKLI